MGAREGRRERGSEGGEGMDKKGVRARREWGWVLPERSSRSRSRCPPSPLLRGRGARSRELLDPPPAPQLWGRCVIILASEIKLAPAAAGAVEMVPGEERARGETRDGWIPKKVRWQEAGALPCARSPDSWAACCAACPSPLTPSLEPMVDSFPMASRMSTDAPASPSRRRRPRD